MKYFTLFAVLCVLGVSVALAGGSDTGILDIYCNVDFAYQGDQTLTLYNLPDGGGSSFSQAQLPDGSFADATLRVQLLDDQNDPIAFFPSEDIWLESVESGLAPCLGGSSADMNTDEDGWTVWAEPLNAGGYSTSGCRLLVSGVTPVGWEDLDIQFNSPDINGDGVINLLDIQFIASSYFGGYSFTIDFYYDGVINLLDIGVLAGSIGRNCPSD